MVNFVSQKGQAMVETIIVFTVILLLILGAIQFALIYHAKVTLNYATFEAARAGALNHASRRSMEYALARGLAPLYAYSEVGASMLDNVSNVKQARDRVLQEIDGNDPAIPNDPGEQSVCIERINPTPIAFTAYGITDPNGILPYDIIPNDNLIYRDASPIAGSASIQDANLLKIRVTYCYEMIIPFISTIVQKLMLGVSGNDSDIPPGWTTPSVGNFKTQCFIGASGTNDPPRFPIVSQSIVRMQTPAMNDPTFSPSCQ